MSEDHEEAMGSGSRTHRHSVFEGRSFAEKFVRVVWTGVHGLQGVKHEVVV